MSAQLEIESQRVRASQIPRSALALDDSGRLGVRVLEGQTVAFRPVSVLSDDTNHSNVTGLGETELVIVRGGDFTKAGQRIEAKIETSATIKAAEAN